MSKLFRLFLAIVLGIWSMPVFAEVVVTIPINVNMPAIGAGNVNVEIRNRSNDTVVTDLIFNAGSATLANPWVAADQYLDVDYSATYNSTWGVRIVTDNEDLEGDTNDTIDTLTAADASAAAGVQSSYSGLIVPTSTDPSRRAALAWQVFASPQTGITVPSSTVAPDATLGGTVLSDKNTPASASDSVGPWNAAWAYLADKNNYDFNGSILEAAQPDGLVNDPTYCMALVGPSGGGNGTLAQHPQATSKPGDTTGIAVYLTARFANTNWGNAGDAPIAYLLPTGAYAARLYVELIHE